MRRAGIAVVALTALSVFAASTYAQQPGKGRKAATQTHDQGVDDDSAPAAQASKEPADRVISQVPITVHASGVAVAELDESFDEAIVVTINEDGTKTYREVRGDHATKATLDPAPAPAAPVLEEK